VFHVVLHCAAPAVCVAVQTTQRTSKRVDEVDPEEMERRVTQMRQQRDLLLKKKKKEQEERLRSFTEARGTPMPSTLLLAHVRLLFVEVDCHSFAAVPVAEVEGDGGDEVAARAAGSRDVSGGGRPHRHRR
jgi:hypothetical protein